MKRRPEYLPLVRMPQSNKTPTSKKYLLSPEPPVRDSPKDADTEDIEVKKEEPAPDPQKKRDSPSENLELDHFSLSGVRLQVGMAVRLESALAVREPTLEIQTYPVC